MRTVLHVLAAASLALPAAAQLTPGHVVAVTTHQKGSLVLDVDPVTGAFGKLGYAATSQVASAVLFDPVDGGIVIAVEEPSPTGPGATRLMRFDLKGGGLGTPRFLARIPGRVTALGLASPGEIVAAVEAFSSSPSTLHRLPRNGGPVKRVATFPKGLNATAMWLPPFSNYALVAIGGPAKDPQILQVDLAAGTVRKVGSLPGMRGRRITGLADLPTGAPRQVLSDDLGRIHLFEFFSSLKTLPVNPPLPSGGSIALRLTHGTTFTAYVLGGGAHPYFILVDVFGSTAGKWKKLAGPLPGAPAAFHFAGPPGPSSLRFGSSCPPGGSTWISTGLPRLGTTFNFGLARAPAKAPVLALFGRSDQRTRFGPLPLSLPGGCLLLVSFEVMVPLFTDTLGRAVRRILDE